MVTGGQRNDGAMLETVLREIYVPRPGRGRARSRPDAVLADRGYASGVIRRQLRSRGIKTVIPEKRDSIAARKRRALKSQSVMTLGRRGCSALCRPSCRRIVVSAVPIRLR